MLAKIPKHRQLTSASCCSHVNLPWPSGMFPEHQQGKQPGLSIRLMLSLIQRMTKAQFLVILGPSVTAFTLAISFTPEAKVSAEGSGFSLGICHSEHQSWMHLRSVPLSCLYSEDGSSV